MTEGASTTASRGAAYGRWVRYPAMAEPMPTSQIQATAARTPPAAGGTDNAITAMMMPATMAVPAVSATSSSGCTLTGGLAAFAGSQARPTATLAPTPADNAAAIRAGMASGLVGRRTARRPTAAPPSTATA